MPKKHFIAPNLIGMLIPDHRDPTLKRADVVTDCATFHSSMVEIKMEPLLEAKYLILVECPTCGETGRIIIDTWRMQAEPEITIKCIKCNQPFNIRQAQALYFAGHKRKK